MRRAALDGHCPRCGLVVLSGPDADTAALTAVVDPHPVDARLELLALLTGRATYDAWRRPDGNVELERRDRWSTAARRTDVLAEHRCGAALTSATEPVTKPRATEFAVPDRPEF